MCHFISKTNVTIVLWIGGITDPFDHLARLLHLLKKVRARWGYFKHWREISERINSLRRPVTTLIAVITSYVVKRWYEYWVVDKHFISLRFPGAVMTFHNVSRRNSTVRFWTEELKHSMDEISVSTRISTFEDIFQQTCGMDTVVFSQKHRQRCFPSSDCTTDFTMQYTEGLGNSFF